MSVLGYDIDGQPLRAGDRVVILDGSTDNNGDDKGGIETEVIGATEYFEGNVDLALPGIAGGNANCAPGILRKLPPKANHEPGSWEEIAKLGWKPEGVEA